MYIEDLGRVITRKELRDRVERVVSQVDSCIRDRVEFKEILTYDSD